MRVHVSVCLAALSAVAILPSQASSQDTFEGVVTFRMETGPQGPQTMTYSSKGNKARMDIAMGGMSMFTVIDRSTHTMDMVMPSRQMYMERSADAMMPPDSAMSNVKITWTGRKETIAGYECEHAMVKGTDGQSADVCLAKGLGAFMGMGSGPGGRGRGAPPAWQESLGKMFPLKVMQGDTVEMEATSIQKKTLDASLFTIPAGYTKMSMPGGGTTY